MRGVALQTACVVYAVCSLAACGGDAVVPADAGRDAGARDGGLDSGPACSTDEQCDDRVYCNGTERCAEGRCVAAAGPCSAAETCNEDIDLCTCTDADGDGHGNAACGDDCDDGDPERYSGNVEVCDAAGRDEDCDLDTMGVDEDGDGFVASRCCQADGEGAPRCGDDCDDTRIAVNPAAREVCNRADDDCDGTIDEGALHTYCADADGDTFGDPAVTTMDCSPAPGWVLNCSDCAGDMSGAVHPSATELCDGVDNDCNGEIDPGCVCLTGETQTCGASDGSGGFLTAGICRTGVQMCAGAAWGDCTGAVLPTTEACNEIDDDCDGSVDEGRDTSCYTDGDGDGYAPLGASSTSACTCPTHTTARAPAGADIDCDDSAASIHPTAGELCDGIDDDCDGAFGNWTAGTLGDPVGEDVDHDGYANGGCGGDDCDDGCASVHPGSTERCNHVSDSCSPDVTTSDVGVDRECTATIVPSSSEWICGRTAHIGPACDESGTASYDPEEDIMPLECNCDAQALLAVLRDPVDLTGHVSVHAQLGLRALDGHTAAGGYALLVGESLDSSGTPRVGTAGAGLGIPYGRRGYAFIVDVEPIGSSRATARIDRLDGGGSTIAAPVALPAACIPSNTSADIRHSITVTMTISGGLRFDIVCGLAYRTTVTVDAATSRYFEDFYRPSNPGPGCPSYNRFQFGMSGASYSAERMRVKIRSFSVSRLRDGSGAGACVPCSPY